jgi:hypothetical protein
MPPHNHELYSDLHQWFKYPTHDKLDFGFPVLVLGNQVYGALEVISGRFRETL